MRSVKVVNKKTNSNRRLLYEIEMLKHLDHPNIIRLHEVFDCETSTILVTEFCEGENLFDVIAKQKNLSEKDAVFVIKQLL